MFGGSPMRVAVPPMLDEKAQGRRNATGFTFNVRAISIVTGMMRSIVVTLSRKAEMKAVINMSIEARMKTFPDRKSVV
jgi:hypothetical protein